jgi:hypothetical protein
VFAGVFLLAAGSRPFRRTRATRFSSLPRNTFEVHADPSSPQGVRRVGRRFFDNLNHNQAGPCHCCEDWVRLQKTPFLRLKWPRCRRDLYFHSQDGPPGQRGCQSNISFRFLAHQACHSVLTKIQRRPHRVNDLRTVFGAGGVPVFSFWGCMLVFSDPPNGPVGPFERVVGLFFCKTVGDYINWVRFAKRLSLANLVS